MPCRELIASEKIFHTVAGHVTISHPDTTGKQNTQTSKRENPDTADARDTHVTPPLYHVTPVRSRDPGRTRRKIPAHPTGHDCRPPQTMPQHPCNPHTPRVTHRRRFIPRPQNCPHPHAAGPHVCAIALGASVSFLRVAPPWRLSLLSLPASSHRPALLRGGSGFLRVLCVCLSLCIV